MAGRGRLCMKFLTVYRFATSFSSCSCIGLFIFVYVCLFWRFSIETHILNYHIQLCNYWISRSHLVPYVTTQIIRVLTVTREIVIGFTCSPNFFLHQRTYLVQSFSGAVVLTNLYWQQIHTVLRKTAFRLCCYNSIKPFIFFLTQLVLNQKYYRDRHWRFGSNKATYLQDLLHCPKGSKIAFVLFQVKTSICCICNSPPGKNL